jgi:hypothetical protein
VGKVFKIMRGRGEEEGKELGRRDLGYKNGKRRRMKGRSYGEGI